MDETTTTETPTPPAAHVRRFRDFLAEQGFRLLIEELRGTVRDEPTRQRLDEQLKLAVVERHRGTGNVGVAFTRGFGLKRGAVASSVAHDSHNVVVLGADDASVETAVRRAAAIGGGGSGSEARRPASSGSGHGSWKCTIPPGPVAPSRTSRACRMTLR